MGAIRFRFIKRQSEKLRRKMNPEDFIADWIEKNPKGCQILTGAVLYSYFNDASEETGERILSLDKLPDAEDLHHELISAIRRTDLIGRIEGAIGKTGTHGW